MKKKILFCVHNFQHGGISKALQNLLEVVPPGQLDVSIFCACHEGAYADYFSKFNLLPQDKLLWSYCVNYRKLSGLKKWFALGSKIARKCMLKFGVDLLKSRLQNVASKLSKRKYDVVIAYAEGMITHFVADIEGAYRIAWMHCDYARYLDYGEEPLDHICHRYDAIVSPSVHCAQSLIRLLPASADKVVSIPNFLNQDKVREMSISPIEKDPRFDNSVFTLISVGRICFEKRFFEVPRIARCLIDDGLDFRWYIIGEGSPSETSFLSDKIAEYGVSDNVVLLGSKDNPYSYIKEGDCLIVLSYSETFSYVVFEARALGIPVIITDFGAASEIMQPEYGSIKTLSEIAGSIMDLAKNKGGCYDSIKRNLKAYNYDNNSILDKFYTVISK